MRNYPWSHFQSRPAAGEPLSELPSGIMIHDIVGIKIPYTCKNLKEGYDALKSQGETFLDGQILTSLILKGWIRRTPLWNHPEFTTRSYGIFAGTLIDFNCFGWHQGFTTVGCNDDGETPELYMFGWNEQINTTERDPTFFAVKRRT